MQGLPDRVSQKSYQNLDHGRPVWRACYTSRAGTYHIGPWIPEIRSISSLFLSLYLWYIWRYIFSSPLPFLQPVHYQLLALAWCTVGAYTGFYYSFLLLRGWFFFLGRNLCATTWTSRISGGGEMFLLSKWHFIKDCQNYKKHPNFLSDGETLICFFNIR